MKAQPRARTAYRVPRTPVGMLFDLGSPSPSLRYVAGKVTDTATDTCTCLINGEEIPRVAVLGNMPDINDLVDIYQLGDLLYIPNNTGSQVIIQDDEPTGVPVGTLWFDTDEVRP